MPRPPSAASILKNAKKDKRKFESKTPIATDMFLPNHSGDLSKGKVRTTPTQDLNPVNKKYVDDAIHPKQHAINDAANHTSPLDPGQMIMANVITGLPNNATNTNVEVAGAVNHSTGDGSDHADVASNTTHRNDNSQAHTDYMLNTGDTTTGNYTFTGNLTVNKNAPSDMINFNANSGSSRVNIRQDASTDMRLMIYDTDGNADIRLDSKAGVNSYINNGGDFGVGTSSPTLKLDVNAKSGMSSIGGFCIKLTNKTGGNTVQGKLIIASTGTADAFATTIAGDTAVIGIVLEAGVADGSEAWIVVSGIADVLIDAGGTALGDRLVSSATAGSATVSNIPSNTAHFKEIGHCIEARVGVGLARSVLHFN